MRVIHGFMKLPSTTARRQSGGGVSEQIAGGHLQGSCQLLDHRNRGIACTTLDIADIGPVDAGIVGESFLTEAQLTTEAANVAAKASTNIHLPT